LKREELAPRDRQRNESLILVNEHAAAIAANMRLVGRHVSPPCLDMTIFEPLSSNERGTNQPYHRASKRNSKGDTKMKASSLSFRAAVLLVITGMIWGISMAISENHQTMPAHAHLNLLGWVSLFLFGIFYHLHPAIDRSRAAMVQVWTWIGATVLLVIGVGLIYTGRPVGDRIAAIASIIILLDMVLFASLVFRRDALEASTRRASVVPAE
jgi:FtsH-binding integral membrane protein